MRNGTYRKDGATEDTDQSLTFAIGDKLKVAIKKGTKLAKVNSINKHFVIYLPLNVYIHQDVVAETDYPVGHEIQEGSQLIKITKGAYQILEERNVNYCRHKKCDAQAYADEDSAKAKVVVAAYNKDRKSHDKFQAMLNLPTKADKAAKVASLRKECSCARCILSQQADFKNQKNGLQEAYDKFNKEHGTDHECVFLPKYHPELNPIERCWGRMKRYIRLHSDGTMATLRKHIDIGLGKTI